MTNKEIAKILGEMAVLYEMEDIAFKPRAYERASEEVGALNEEVKEIYKREGFKALTEIPGVGQGIARHLEGLFKTGHFKEYDRLKKKIPVNISELTSIEGVGPKMVKVLYEELGIKNLSQLEYAARKGKLRGLPRMGEKMEKKILKGIEFKKAGGGRFGIGEVLPAARAIKARKFTTPVIIKSA